MLVFFGDLTTQSVVEDAHACVGMAFEMQRRLAELNVKWRKQGIEQPFRARMGINTGYCNVGNFGSEQRMDYTIIGAEANLAARLQSIAQPGEIVLSYETFILVSDVVRGRALEPFTLKGIGRPIMPYVVDAAEGKEKVEQSIITEHSPGIDLFLDVRAVTSTSSERIAQVLETALAAVRNAATPAAGSADLKTTEAAGRA
jgi:class 3 adenylate cyclase